MRADAQRNLDRLLTVAGECLAERGLDVSVDEIARRAGVGHGTVFRRFASKDELVAAVLRQQLEELTETAVAAAADEDAWAGLERFVRTAAAGYAKNRALFDGIERCIRPPDKERLVAAVAEIVDRAHRTGAIRADVTTDDVMELMPTAVRYPDVVLDGLRAR
jgi:AcrR family transcriptional regulator